MSTTSIILATTASSTNSSNKQEIKKLHCEALVPQFNNTTATIEQKQKYADCIDVLYPVSTTGEVLFAKFLIILAFVCFGVTAYVFTKAMDLFAGILCGAIAALAIPLAVSLVVAAISFLFCGV